MDEIAGRLEACLSAIAKASSGSPSDASIHSASRPLCGQDAMTTNDVAELLGCSYTEARDRLLDGRIKAVKDGRWLRTRREWVEEYIARKTIQVVNAVPGVHTVPRPRKRPTQGTVTVSGIGLDFLRERAK
jgi:excisionase family DNA binding protein